jgi:hypothetical protein
MMGFTMVFFHAPEYTEKERLDFCIIGQDKLFSSRLQLSSLSVKMCCCRLYPSFALSVPEFCACATNSIEWPVEPFEREIISEARRVALTHSEHYKAASHAGSHGFFRLRKTNVPKAQNLRTTHIPQFRERKNRIANTPDQADEEFVDEELSAPGPAFASVTQCGCVRDQCPQNTEKSSASWDDWLVY